MTERKSILSTPISRRSFGKGVGLAAAGTLAGAVTPFNIVRAQGGPLKIGLLLPRSGIQAGLGQSCYRGAEIAPGLLKEMGFNFPIEIMSADTESNVDVARSRAEKLIADGAQMLVGAFDSGQTNAIAQVAEQKGVPHVINIGADPKTTQQGYKFVFRVFLTAPQLITNGLALFKDLFAATKTVPKTAVFMHVNDTFGQAIHGAVNAIAPRVGLPFKILDTISYDPAARDLSVEVAKAKGTGAELLMLVSRLNDGILLVREMVKQRWEPMGIMSPGSPGMYDEPFLKSLGKYSEYCISNVPWFNPKAPLTGTILKHFKAKYPNDVADFHLLNLGYTFEAILVCADAYKRAGSTNGTALAEALRKTKITQRAMVGGPIEFDANGQNNSNKSACVQNRNGVPTVVLPADAAVMAPVFPMPGWASRT
ncbi:MAG TPA: ABC transporter substrate-binding protein [bacterium]